MVTDIYLDPFLFSCPHIDEGALAFENYVDNITSWRELRSISWAGAYISEKTAEILCSTNSYPFWGNIDTAIRKFNIQYLQTKDIIIVINSLLQKAPHIEKQIRIKEILTKDVKSKPSKHLKGRPVPFQEHHDRLLLMMCLACRFENKKEENQIFITPKLAKDSLQIRIVGIICDFEFYREPRKVKTPCTLRGRFHACINQEALHLSMNPVAIWTKAKTRQEYTELFEIYLRQFSHKLGMPISETNWLFGTHFFETANNLGFLDDKKKTKKLLRACAKTVLQQNLGETHHLREGVGSETPQRKRNGDAAWRRDIDRTYHLHYWEIANGLEFASVVIHNDMGIPY